MSSYSPKLILKKTSESNFECKILAFFDSYIIWAIGSDEKTNALFWSVKSWLQSEMFWNIFCDMYRWKIWYHSLCLFVMNVATSSWPLYWSAVDPSHTWDKVVHIAKIQVKWAGYHSFPTVNHSLPTLTLLGPIWIKINTVSVNLNNTGHN